MAMYGSGRTGDVMLRISLPLLLLLSLAGCASLPTQTSEPKTEPGDNLASIRAALRGYHDCLKQKVEPYLKTKAKPKAVAEAVAKKCEPALNEYKFAVREFYVQGLSPQTEGYNKVLLAKPEAHAKRVRAKGESATIARVLEARKPEPH
jgi:hypothetical protein